MRIALLTLIFTVCVTITAQARLGETQDQLIARYGQPVPGSDQKDGGDTVPATTIDFEKGGFHINVTLANGISVAEKFNKINGGGFALGEVRTLLNANSQGLGWEAPHVTEGVKKWARDDGATAELSQGFLTITSKELISAQAAAKKIERAPTLEGF